MVAVPDTIPRELRERAQWLCWRLRPNADGKLTKVPMSPHGGAGSSTNPKTWSTFEQACLEQVRRGYDGIGFVLWKGRAPDAHLKTSARHDRTCPGFESWHFQEDDPPADPFSGADLDHCLNGRLDPWASDVVRELASYTEITPSGEGLRVFVIGTLPPGGRKVGNLELYDSGRYLTVTGNHYDDTPLRVEERTDALLRVHARMVEGVGVPKAHPKAATTTTAAPLTDDELIKKACSANDGGKFAQLWMGSQAGFPSMSEGDLALCNGLAYWTEGDAARMERLFTASSRMRPKWDERHAADGRTYGQRTLATALESYRARFPSGSASVIPPEMARPTESAVGIRPLRELMAEDLPPAEHVVPNWLQTGLVILAGKPKIGKSWMMLSTALAVAAGGIALGKLEVTQPADVLYLALEDPKRRLQDRVRKLLGPQGVVPERFDYSITCPKLGDSGVEFIEAWLESKGPGALVVVDIWKRVKPKPDKGANAYDADYDAAMILQTIAIKRRVCIVLLHHTNKIKSDDDTDIISGSIGFSAAADEFMVLLKAGKKNAVLRGGGRDVVPFDWALEWSVEAASWSIIGDADEEEASRQEQETVAAVEEFGKPLKPHQLAVILGIHVNTANQRLYRAVKHGVLVSLNDGAYYTSLPVRPVRPVSAVSPVSHPSPDSPDHPDHTDASDRSDSTAVFVLHRCRGACGNYLKGSEERGGICRACAQKEIEDRDAEPY